MAGGDNKTEKATPKKKEDARKEGNVARSMEINSAIAMLAGFGVLSMLGPYMWEHVTTDMIARIKMMAESPSTNMNSDAVMEIFFGVVKHMTLVVGPIMMTMLVAGVLSSIIQVKPKVQMSIIKPRLTKLNPISGAKQKFGPAAGFELTKTVLKMVVVGVPAGILIWGRKDEILMLGDAEPLVAGSLIVDLAFSVGLRIGALYLAIALIDYLWQRYRYEKNLRMTKHEVKQEMRQQDLAPEVRQQIKRRQREAARKRMLGEVPEADVIITNPTHYSVAIKYDSEQGAPQVVAKGVDLLAMRIREIADDAGVQRVENVALARELYARVDVGTFIPGDMFAAVAEVLAFVYRANKQRTGQREQAEQRISA